MLEMFMLPVMPSTSTRLLPCLELMFVMHVCTRMELDHVKHVGKVCGACIECPPHMPLMYEMLAPNARFG